MNSLILPAMSLLNVVGWLNGRFSALHLVVASSISSGEITIYTNNNKVETAVQYVKHKCLPDFLVMVIQFTI